MSYILEALRKSEQERNADKVPDLTTSHTHIHKEKKTNYLWWIIAAVLVVANGLYLFNKMTKDSSPEVVSQPIVESEQKRVLDKPVAETVSEKQHVENSPNAIQPETNPNTGTNAIAKESSDINLPASEQQNQFVTTKPMVQNTAPIDSKMLPDITTLSYNVQQQLPEMEYTTHIHVKEGGSFIIINGRSFGEGQQITQGLTIVQIHSDGIILDFKGRRFFMASMTDWLKN